MNSVFRNPWHYLLFLLPALLLLTVFIVGPAVQSVYYSFHDWNGMSELRFIGFEGYGKLLQDEVFLLSLKNTLLLLAVSVFVGVPIALLLAIVLNYDTPVSKVYKTALFLPTVLSTVIVGLIWTFVYHPSVGPLNSVLRALGFPDLARPWLAEAETALGSVLVANWWQWNGLHTVILYAGIRSIPDDLFEAARMDGVSRWKQIPYIIVPLVWPTITVDLLISITGSLRAFDIVYVMTGGGPSNSSELMATYMYKKAFVEFNFGYGSTIAAAIFALTLAVSLLFQRFSQGKSYVASE